MLQGGAIQVQDHSTAGPLGLPSLDMGQRACSDQAKGLSSHAGAVGRPYWEPVGTYNRLYLPMM